MAETRAAKPSFDESKFMRLQKWVQDGERHLDKQRREQRESYRYVAGDQWSDADKTILEEQMRPVITFNRIGVIIDSVTGLEINNREETRYYPREMGDVKVSEMITAAAEWVRDQTNAEDEESDSFTDLITCGLGWMEEYLTTDQNQNGQIDIKMARVDPLEMGYDPSSKRRNLIDAKYVYRIRDIPEDEAREMFPGQDVEALDAGWASGRAPDQTVHRREMYQFNKDKDYRETQRGYVTLVEVQWWEKKTFYKVEDPETGEVADYDEKKFGTLQSRLKMIAPDLALNYATFRRRVYKRAFLGADRILKESPTPCPYSFSYHAITGKRDHINQYWYGLVRAMKDPQMWANKWLSQILHIINSNSKGGFMAARSDFEDPRDVEANWSRPDYIAWLTKQGKNNPPTPKPPVQLPQGIQYLMEFAVGAIRDVTGASVEMLGLADRDQAASLEYQRRQAGVTVMAGFFNSLRQYRKEQGRSLLYIVQKWISDGRLVRILGQDGNKQYVPLMKDKDVVEYDVIVDEAPSSPNHKEAIWGMMVQMMPFLQNAPLPGEVWADLIKYSPLPSSLAEKIGSALNAPPDEAQVKAEEQMRQATLAMMQAEAQKTSADAMKSQEQAKTEKTDRVANIARAQKDMAETQAVNMETMLQRLEAMERTVSGLTLRPQPELQPMGGQ